MKYIFLAEELGNFAFYRRRFYEKALSLEDKNPPS
jgi:hypothetical protein